MKRILYLLISLTIVSSLFAAGCLLKDEVTAPSTEGTVLNLYGSDPLTLDPAVSGEMTSHGYILQIFSGLVRLDDNMEPAPDIAKRWEISDDGRTYTFYLRKDVKFHNGREVKAEDFKYSWQRACDPATGSLTATTFLGDIVGTEEVIAGKSKEISGVNVINDYVLQVKIDAPRSYFLSKLTYPVAFVVDEANAKSGNEWWRNPNGTGPFILKKWERETSLVLERNDHYYNHVAGVESVVFNLWGGVPMHMYETGEIDVTGVSLSYIDRVNDKAGPFYDELVIAPELSFYYIGFNTTEPPFDDVNIRRAFSLAIDKDKIASLVFRDMVQSADGILPPGMPGHNKDLSGLIYDVEQARQLIKNSKYGDVSLLPPITITTTGWGGSISQELESLVHEWRQNLGVEVKVRQLEPQRFLYYLREEKDEMFLMGWTADYPHPHNFLDVLFRTRSTNNYGDYSNPEVDALLKIANAEMDNDISLGLYQQIEQKLVEDAACLPLWFSKNYILVKPYIKGFKMNPQGVVMLNRVTID